jgi:hypothetical protein
MIAGLATAPLRSRLRMNNFGPCLLASGIRNSIFVLVAALLLPLTALAAVDGTVVNQTTGKPQPNVTVSLIQPGQNGMQTLGSVKSDAQGRFKIDKDAEGPVLVQALFAGVPYNKMLPPGTPKTGVEVNVFDSTSKPGIAQVNQHMALLQPTDTGLSVNEMYIVRNNSNETYNDPAKGTLQFYLMPGRKDVRVTITAPGGMPIQRPAQDAGAPNIFKVAYPIKPGETRFDLTYAVDTASREFSGKVLQTGGQTRLVVPNGVTLEGNGIEQLGQEPQTQAKIYGVKGDAYTVKVAGSGSLAAGGAEQTGGAQQEDTGQPQIQQSNPRIYDRLYIILGLAFGILALGIIVLYRSQAQEPKR